MQNNKMILSVGEPGTGKSYTLIESIVKLEKDHKSFYVMTPTNTSKERLLRGFKQKHKEKNINDGEFYDILANCHTLEFNYNNETNIFIDEFSMIDLNDWYSLLYQILNNSKPVNIYAFGDAKQLDPVRGAGALAYLLKTNFYKFGVNTMGFSQFSATQLYDKVKNGSLEVPEGWKLAIESINLTISRHNYRLDEVDGITSYNDDFLQYIQDNTLMELPNLKSYLEETIQFMDNGYLIITPVHRIGEQIDDYLNENYKEEAKDIAPFIRNKDTVYQNPNCKVKYGFNFVPYCNDKEEMKNCRYSYYVTVHSCQGCTVNSVVFCTLDSDIEAKVKDFYSCNLLYTALTRSKHIPYILGKLSVFAEMRTNYKPLSVNYINTGLNNQALNLTYNTIINIGSEKFFENDEIYDLYKENFQKVIKNNDEKVDVAMAINPEFEPKPFTKRRVLKVLDIKTHNKFTNDLIRLGYGFSYVFFVEKQLSDGRSAGGKRSQVEDWWDTLDEQTKNKVIKDSNELSRRKFYSNWKHDIRSVKPLVEKYLKK